MPAGNTTLIERLMHGLLVLDGAMGTELERRGVPTPAPLWSAAALVLAPHIVTAIHRDYVEAGADILVANTFRTNPRTLRETGHSHGGSVLNRCAVVLARVSPFSTSSRAVFVAASVGPVEDCYHPERVPEEAVLLDEHRLMMAWLQEAAPDLIWIETIGTVREARAAAHAAAERGLPFVISFITAETGDLLGGEPLADAVAAVEPLRPLAIGLNCIPPRGLTAILPRLRDLTRRRLAAYAHINNPTPLRGWSYAEAATPEQYAAYARQWLDLGASIIGGCCGTTPAHIAAMREAVRNSATR